MTDINNATTHHLLNVFVYGREPLDCNDIEAELKRRGIEPSELIDKIDKLIRECLYATDKP